MLRLANPRTKMSLKIVSTSSDLTLVTSITCASSSITTPTYSEATSAPSGQKCPNPLLQRKVEDLRNFLLSDYQYLRRRCEAVAKRAEQASNTIIRDIQHRESSRSITQANKVSSLTTLAYLFLPWSLAASVFGMHVTQMVEGRTSLCVAICSHCDVFASSSSVCDLWN
jgi:hypothetical protein